MALSSQGQGKGAVPLDADGLMTDLGSLGVLALQTEPQCRTSHFHLIGICGLGLLLAPSQRGWLKCQDIFFRYIRHQRSQLSGRVNFN